MTVSVMLVPVCEMSAVIYDGLSDVSTRMCNVSFENIFIKHPNIYTNIAMGVTIIK